MAFESGGIAYSHAEMDTDNDDDDDNDNDDNNYDDQDYEEEYIVDNDNKHTRRLWRYHPPRVR